MVSFIALALTDRMPMPMPNRLFLGKTAQSFTALAGPLTSACGASLKCHGGHNFADTTTPHGRLMLIMLSGLAEFERHLIRASAASTETTLLITW
jgi:hypothetical protein